MDRDKFGRFIKGHFVPKKWIEITKKTNKGHPAWNKGKHLSPEHIEKMRQRGLNMPQAQRDKVSKKMKALWKIPKYRNHMSKINIGRTSFNKGKHLSKEHKEKLSKSHIGILIGNKHPNWKGGKFIQDGYLFILKPNHPFVSKKGYVAEHRLVMEKHLGRYLKPKEVIHHINEDTLDNRIENLKLFKSQYFHMLYHKKLNKFREHPLTK